MPITSVTVDEAARLLKNEHAVLIDVREPEEHAAASIAGATLIPLGHISIEAIPDTDKKIVLYCHKGIRSMAAAEALLRVKPDLDMYNISGGIVAWHQADLPLS